MEAMSKKENYPSTFCARHDEFPELKDAKLGQEVELKVKAKVVGLRAADMHSKGETNLEILAGNKSDKEAAPEDMSAEEMRKKLPVKDEEEDY